MQKIGENVMEKDANKKQSRVCGADVGTMFFQTAEKNADNKIELKNIRNAFVQIEATDDIEDVLSQNKWKFVRDDGDYFVIGEDSLRVAKLFPGKVELRRPMESGVLNKNEEKKMLVLSELINTSLGKAPNDKSVVCTCVSSPPTDGSADSAFHKARLMGMFKKNGWNVKVIEEGLAVILSERPVVVEEDGTESPYSGIGISFGAGRVNCVLAYKGLKILGMSTSRSGDWIDNKVSEQLGISVSKVTSAKEKRLDFNNLDEDDDILYALDVYYGAMIEYVLKNFAVKFANVESEFDSPLDIVVAGGTSMPKGFCNKIEEVIRGLKLPFKVKDVKHSADPRNSVVKGCLTQAMITQKKINKSSDDDLSSILGD
jgi:actin-like ATPase involved in cell morphogenesis